MPARETTARAPASFPAGSAERTTNWHRLLLTAGLVTTGLVLRMAVASIGPALDDIQNDLHASGTAAGIITTLPVICFAVIGVATNRLATLVGEHLLLAISLAVGAAGVAGRVLVGDATSFALLTVAALVAGATGNVLLPGLVKQHFPDRIGPMTALYTTSLAVGATAASGLTVPIGDAAGSWRTGLGVWAVFFAIAIVPWLGLLRHDPRAARTGANDRPKFRELAHSPTAWLLAVLFGTQGMQAYITFGWFARLLVAYGVSATQAGLMLAVLNAITIPLSLAAPRVAPSKQRAFAAVLAACNLVAYIGLLVAPREGAWVWMVLNGIGSGLFPLLLTLIGQRARTAGTTAALSAFVQPIGYVISGAGPFLFGLVYDLTQSWRWPLLVAFVALAVMSATGWWSFRPRDVDAELARRRPA